MQISVEKKHINKKFFLVNKQTMLIADKTKSVARSHNKLLYLGNNGEFNVAFKDIRP
jgi:hypothetical protein